MKNIEENSVMTLVSIQAADGQTDKQEFTTDCSFYKTGEAFYITYKEHSEMGMGETRVFIKAADKTVTVRRMGDFRSIMCYEEGKITDSVYRMPFGQMEIKIKTSRISLDLSEEGGSLEMRYSLFIGSGCSENEIRISVT